MKKKILGGAFIIALVAFATININLNKVGNKCDFAMANVEALAVESGDQVSCGQTYGFGVSPIIQAYDCVRCNLTNCRVVKWPSTCVIQ